jgi:hypothetical protein
MPDDFQPGPEQATEHPQTSPEPQGSGTRGDEGAFLALIDRLMLDKPTDIKGVGENSWPGLLARLAKLSRRFSQSALPGLFFREAYYAARLLERKDEEGRLAAADVIDDLEISASRSRPIRFVMLGVLSYLVVTAIFAAVVFGYAVDLAPADGPPLAFGAGQPTIALNTVAACVFGALGAIVSIILRLSEFESLGGRTRVFLIVTGALLPVVGSNFAIVSYSIFASNLLQVSAEGNSLTAVDTNLYLAIVIGFVSGFSERFTRGMLEKIGWQPASAKVAAAAKL